MDDHYGYDVVAGDALMTYDEGMKAARLLGAEHQMKQAVREIIGRGGIGGELVRANLECRLKG